MFPVIKRREAAERGETFFFSGRPCSRGHIAQRYVSCGVCVECGKQTAKTYSVGLRKTRELRENAASRRLVLVQSEVHPDDVAELTAFANALRLTRGLPAAVASAPPVRPPELSPTEIFAERCRILGTSVVLAEYKRAGRPIPDDAPQFATPEPETGNHWPTHDPY